MYTSALASPPRFQWEPNSAPSQAYNCGPTCVTQIAEFYKDRWFSIEETRRLITSCCHATTYSQQRDMLIKRGVPAVIYNITSLRQLHTITDTGTRPVILALYMARVPASVRGHSFTGWHAVVVRKGVTGGFWVTDPNFSPPGGVRPDPTGGKRWYSDAVIQSAFLDNDQHYAIVPNAAKYIPPPPPTTHEPTAIDLADGDPFPMRIRRISDNNDRFVVRKIKAGKPVRKGRLVTNSAWSTTTKETPFSIFARIPKADMPLSEQKYGDVFIGLWYHENGDHLGYVKAVDLK